MAVGRTPMQPGLLSSTVGFCEGRLAPNSIYAVLHRGRRRRPGNEAARKAAGAHGVVKMGNAIQVVIGADADPIAADIEDMT